MSDAPDTAKHRCGRRDDMAMWLASQRGETYVPPAETPDTWEIRNTGHPGILGEGQRACSYCGSMHPDDLFDSIAAGAEIVPTDKGYKAYVEFTDGRSHKFYYQHLDVEQSKRFVEIHASGKMRVGYPGYFYAGALPFWKAKHG